MESKLIVYIVVECDFENWIYLEKMSIEAIFIHDIVLLI